MITSNNGHRRPAVLTLVSLIVLSACGGPQAPLAIGKKEVTLDLLLGAKKAVARAPIPSVMFGDADLGFQFFSADEAPPSGVSPKKRRTFQEATPSCPDNPLAVPKTIASNRVAGPPASAQYLYRAAGSFKTGGANPTEEKVPSLARLEVGGVVGTTGGIPTSTSWHVNFSVGNTIATTTDYTAYHIPAPEAADPEVPEPLYPEDLYPTSGDPFASTPALRGKVTVPPYPEQGRIPRDRPHPPKGITSSLFIKKISGSKFGGQGAVPKAFEPPGGLFLAKFPLREGEAYDVTNSDGTTSISYRTTIRPKQHVHACGVAIDTYTIELSRGRIVYADAGEAVEFTAVYQIAPQFGGLFVEESTKVTGTRGATPIERTFTATTTTAPPGASSQS